MWLIFALLNPFSEGFRSLFAKKASHEIDPIYISWANNLIPVIVFTPLIFFVEIKFNFHFWLGLFGSGIINVYATVIYMKALSEGEISNVMPMLSFTPLFLLITGPLMTGELPHLLGIFGVVLIVVGSYLLNLSLSKGDIFAPLKSIIRNKGTQLMFIVAFIWSFSANFDKISLNASSALQHIIFVNILVFSFLSVYLFIFRKGSISLAFKHRKYLLIISSFTTGSFIFHMTALSLTFVAYVVAIKRLSGVISVVLGNIYLNEQNLRERLLGSIIMFIGVLLIVVS